MKAIIFITLLSLTIISCEEPEPYKGLFEQEQTNLRVNYYHEECEGVISQRCLLIQEGNLIGSDEWEYFYDSIDGFNYEAGFLYDLVVDKTTVTDPAADASSIEYKLIETLAKKKH